MALPKLNEVPSYEIKVPSSGQKVTYRPFLVKEQKNLLIALESQERSQMMRSIVKTIEACVEENIKNDLTIFDVDFMFTKIRSKSVGETATLSLECEECEHRSDVSIELEKIKLDGKVVKNKVIPLTNDISVKMRYPTYQDFMNNEKIFENESFTETLLEMVMTCMDSIMTDEERICVKDEPKEEIIDFVESMSSEQFERITEFVNKIPAITQKADFTCPNCGHKNGLELKGIDDFF